MTKQRIEAPSQAFETAAADGAYKDVCRRELVITALPYIVIYRVKK